VKLSLLSGCFRVVREIVRLCFCLIVWAESAVTYQTDYLCSFHVILLELRVSCDQCIVYFCLQANQKIQNSISLLHHTAVVIHAVDNVRRTVLIIVLYSVTLAHVLHVLFLLPKRVPVARPSRL
jgi:hypothetical protein